MTCREYYMDFSSPFGTFHVVWDPGNAGYPLRRIYLSSPGEISLSRMKKNYPEITFLFSPAIRDIGRLVTAFLEGDPVSFAEVPLDFSLCSPFQSAILKTERQIPTGQIVTYSHLAAAAGKNGAARAAGHALARNPYPLIIPCHRAIRSDGTPGGYQGGMIMKKRLLEREGIIFTRDGKIAPEFL
jgi:methylated-DNA-[protein]-cysteine S-methyltransferase